MLFLKTVKLSQLFLMCNSKIYKLNPYQFQEIKKYQNNKHYNKDNLFINNKNAIF